MNNIKPSTNEMVGQPCGCPPPSRQGNIPMTTLMMKAVKSAKELC